MTTLHILPNAHLDPVWLWDATEGFDQGVRSIRATLDLMDEFPFLTYIRGEAALYRHVEETAPDLFARIRERIREGRWDVVGGTVIQPDTNLPRAETLRKQFELGLGWFKDHLGARPRVAWQADAFGHSAGLPDIFAEAGMESFAFWRPSPTLLPLPKQAFWWRGPAGGRVLAYRLETGWYGTGRDEVPRRLDATLAHTAETGLDNAAVFLGLGDHGGGPSRRQILDALAWAEAHPHVKVVWGGLHAFFAALRAEAAAKGGGAYFPEFSGELNFTLRGCYTSGARQKFAFRRAEAEMLVAERAARAIGNCPTTLNVHQSSLPTNINDDFRLLDNGGQLELVDNPTLSAAWWSLCFNAFHDILPGTCMERAAEEQLREIGGVRHAARAATAAALRKIATMADTSVPRPAASDRPAALPFIVFNPHPWPYRGQIELEGCIDDRPDYRKEFGGGPPPLDVRGPSRRRIPHQIVPTEAHFVDEPWRSRVVVGADIPANGFAVYTMGWDVKREGKYQQSQVSTNDTNVNVHSEAAKNGASVANVKVLPMSIPNVANAEQNWKLNLDTGNVSTMATLPYHRFSLSARPGAQGIRILRDGRPWLKGAGLQALLFHDAKGAWGDNAPRQHDEGVPPVAWAVERAEVVESGPLRSALWVRLAGERSWLELTLRLAAGRDAIDIDARLLWNEREALLKLALPCDAVAADCAVPGAVVRRGTEVGEFPAAPWIRALDRAGRPVLGFASDALHGCDIVGGALRPSVVRATGYAFQVQNGRGQPAWRPATDLGEHRFRFLLAPGDANLPRLADELEMPPVVQLAPDSLPGPLGRRGTL